MALSTEQQTWVEQTLYGMSNEERVGHLLCPEDQSWEVDKWLESDTDNGDFFAPEQVQLDRLRWSYQDGLYPILHCRTETGGLQIQHILFQDGRWEDQSEATAARLNLTNPGANPVTVQIRLALRSLAPAGEPLKTLQVGPDRCSLWDTARILPLLGADQLPQAIGCGVGDPSVLARQGQTPGVTAVEDPDGWLLLWLAALCRGSSTLVESQRANYLAPFPHLVWHIDLVSKG